MLQNILFTISSSSASIMLVISMYSLANPQFHFWPPPTIKSWQRKVFFLFFRSMLYSLVILTILRLNSKGISFNARTIVGVILFVIGFGSAFASTLELGWKNAFGDRKGLAKNGWFRFSRNPVYVVTWLGMVGWSLVADYWQISLVLSMWALIYLIAIFLEERWLEKVYKQEYADYKITTARFISFRTNR